ncbi:MAG TPA: 2OG-Fe(II) oxygenase [Steroidobacteraceae bacterium]|nr:2OG-Fe(II) oxygenase [Steroidobacteraceae bacterium]
MAASRAAATGAERLVEALAGPGWGVAADFVPERLVASLRGRIHALEDASGFRPAAVGAGPDRAVRPQIRGDRLCWLGAPQTPAEARLLARLDALRALLNRELTLGLFDLECHYSIYAPGAGYARHLDRSPAGGERVVSAVLYLNAGWGADDGGELCLYAETGPVTVAPRGGSLVLFLSERFEHAVRPASRARLSLTGWFRRRARVIA